MKNKPGTAVTVMGIYWCSVCKLPAAFKQGEAFPPCRNKCGRGAWEFVQAKPAKAAGRGRGNRSWSPSMAAGW